MDNHTHLKSALSSLMTEHDTDMLTDKVFNRYDAPFARDLDSKGKRGEWSDAQASAVYKMLSKYQKQLKGYGIVYGDIPVPKKSPVRCLAKNESRIAIMKDERIFLKYNIRTRDEFNAELAEIKALPGRQFHEETKQWSIPINNYSIDKIEQMGYECSDEILRWKKENDKPAAKIIVPDDVKLYPFQEEGVRMLEQLDGRALLADSMGLGKSAQSICWMKLHPEHRPAIVIVPASLKINWTREFKKWGLKEKITVVSGKSFALSTNEEIVVVNYDVLSHYLDLFEEMNFKLLIADESHFLKNSKALRTRAVKYLAKNIKHIICISGTPIVNRPKEFYTTLNLLMPSMFNSYNRYIDEYCGGFDGGGKGASNTQRLNEILSKSFMIRRLKEDVLKELPDKQISVVPIEIDNRKTYQRAEDDLIEYIREMEGDEKAIRASMAETLVRMEKLKQLSVIGKMSQAIEWIESVLETGKLVVFCTHHIAVDMLMDHFKDVAVKLDGRDSPAAKDLSVERFQKDDKIKLFIGNTKAAGVGLTLTAASTAAFIELGWTPGEMSQCEDRIHRIGQKESCNIYYLVGMDTIEDEIAMMLDEKRKVLSAILDGKSPEDQSLVYELINKYKEKAV